MYLIGGPTGKPVLQHLEPLLVLFLPGFLPGVSARHQGISGYYNVPDVRPLMISGIPIVSRLEVAFLRPSDFLSGAVMDVVMSISAIDGIYRDRICLYRKELLKFELRVEERSRTDSQCLILAFAGSSHQCSSS